MPLEKVRVTRSKKDRIFISIFLAKKIFVWGGDDQQSAAEVQEAVAKALINNQWLEDPDDAEEPLSSTDGQPRNNMGGCAKQPLYKQNMYRFCFKAKTIYICRKCSNPKAARPRKDKGRKGGEKLTHGGFMRPCKHTGCFAKHYCGNIPRRRGKAAAREDGPQYEV